MAKIKLFTHTDLDGISCEILGRLMYSDIDIERLDYSNVNKTITSFVVSGKMAQYDTVFITDLNLDPSTMVVLNSLVENSDVDIRLFDHHQQSLAYNELPWVNAITDIKTDNPYFKNETHKTCGTELFWELYFKDLVSEHSPESIDMVKRIQEYIYFVTMRDTGHFDVLEAVSLNDMMKLYGTEEYMEIIAGRIIMGEPLIQQSDINLLNMETRQKLRYFEKMENKMQYCYKHNHRFGVVFTDRYISELGQHLSSKYPDCDFIALVDLHGAWNGGTTVSLRTIHDHINVSEFAAMFGGGGHPKASGFTVSAEHKLNLIDKLFEIEGDESVEERQTETVEA